MSTHAKRLVVPNKESEQLAVSSCPAEMRGGKGIEPSCLEVPIRVLGYGATSDSSGEGRPGEPFEEDSTTLLVCPQGAVIQLTVGVLRGQELMLINRQSNRYAHCRVTNIRTTAETAYVEIQFTHIIADFWGISFPKDAAAGASAVAAFAARLSAGPFRSEREEEPIAAPSKALAAAAGAGGSTPGAIYQGPALDGTGTIAMSRPSPLTERDQRPCAQQFFAARPMELTPVCEPVVDPGERPAGGGVEAEPVAQVVKWEPLSAPEPQSKKRLVPAAFGVAVCAIILSYHFFAPAEAAMSIDPPDADLPSGNTLQVAGAASVVAAAAGRSENAEPSSVVVVNVPAPDIVTEDPPSRRVVLVSGMTVAAPSTTSHPYNPPELPAAASEEPAVGARSDVAGFLGKMESAPPPPPKAEAAAENPEKAEDTLLPARLLAFVRPSYPPAAERARIEGDVVVEAMIDVSGNVAGMKVLSGPQVLRAAATTALAKWKFQPAVLHGQPTASSSIVKLQFHLR